MCRRHGGTSANHTKHALRLLAEAQIERARTAAATLGLPRDIGPQDALLEEVQRTAGHVTWLGERIAELDPDSLVWSDSGRQLIAEPPGDRAFCAGPQAPPRAEQIQTAPLPVWLEIYQRERKHLVNVARAAIDCGVPERQVALAEAQGWIVARVVTGALADLGVNSEELEVRVAIRRHLVLASMGVASPPRQ